MCLRRCISRLVFRSFCPLVSANQLTQLWSQRSRRRLCNSVQKSLTLIFSAAENKIKKTEPLQTKTHYSGTNVEVWRRIENLVPEPVPTGSIRRRRLPFELKGFVIDVLQNIDVWLSERQPVIMRAKKWSGAILAGSNTRWLHITHKSTPTVKRA